MTAPSTSPSPLYYLLSLYAAVDQKVITLSDVGVSETVEQFMPGTAGANAGWSTSLAELVGPVVPVGEALEGLANGPKLSKPELSRLVFIVGVLIHLPGFPDEDVPRYTDVLALAAPEGATSTSAAGQLHDWLETEFNRWQDWDKIKGVPVAEHFLDADVARVPLCNAHVAQHDNKQCVVIDTLFDDENLTPQMVKDRIDPMNWDDFGGRFFVRMQALRPGRLDGWARVLETTDLTGGYPFSYQVNTNLKFVKIDEGVYAGRLQYELDDFKPYPGDGDGQVTIDHGYINIQALKPGAAKPGVRVKTRKVVRIEGFPPVLQKIWICALGYGHAAMEMIFSTADDKGAVKWNDPPVPVTPAARDASDSTSVPVPDTGGGDKPYPPKTAGALAVTMMSEYLADVSKESAKVAEKWAKGQLQPTDLAQFSSKLGARTAGDPWVFFERLRKLPPPTYPTENAPQADER